MLDDAAPAKPEDQGVAGGRNKRGNTLEISIGRELRSLRKKHDMTVAELGALAKVSSGMLSKIENGLTSPSLATLQALSSALNVSVTAFFRSFEKRRDATFVAAGEGLDRSPLAALVWRHHETAGGTLPASRCCGTDHGLRGNLLTAGRRAGARGNSCVGEVQGRRRGNLSAQCLYQ